MRIFVTFYFNVLFCVINAEESVANPTMQDITKIINGMFFYFFYYINQKQGAIFSSQKKEKLDVKELVCVM
jgi:hypothetical protein